MSDVDALREAIESQVARATGGVAHVRALDKLAGGACQDNYAVTLELVPGPGDAGGEIRGTRRLVLRSDARTSLPGSLDRAQEYNVICAAAAAGVRTPHARWLSRGLTREGANAYYLDWVEGDAIGRRIVTSPKLEAARAGLARACAEELARIHSITPKTHPDLFPRESSA